MQSLVRTRVGNFLLDNALKLGEIEKLVSQGRILDHLLAVDQMLDNYGKIVVRKNTTNLSIMVTSSMKNKLKRYRLQRRKTLPSI